MIKVFYPGSEKGENFGERVRRKWQFMFIQDAQYWSWEQYVYFISFRWSVILLRPSMYGIWEAGTWGWSMSGQNIYPVHDALHLLAAPHSITQMLQFDHDERKSFVRKFYRKLNSQTKHVRTSVLWIILHFWGYQIKNIVLNFEFRKERSYIKINFTPLLFWAC